jgi:hypothetical protein
VGAGAWAAKKKQVGAKKESDATRRKLAVQRSGLPPPAAVVPSPPDSAAGTDQSFSDARKVPIVTSLRMCFNFYSILVGNSHKKCPSNLDLNEAPSSLLDFLMRTWLILMLFHFLVHSMLRRVVKRVMIDKSPTYLLPPARNR